jgi:hypothetical protein
MINVNEASSRLNDNLEALKQYFLFEDTSETRKKNCVSRKNKN